MSRSWAKGSTRQWRRTRLAVLRRDGYACQLRLPGVCTGRATHVHHTQGRALTADDPAYLQASCQACNLATGDPTRHADPPPRPVTSW